MRRHGRPPGFRGCCTYEACWALCQLFPLPPRARARAGVAAAPLARRSLRPCTPPRPPPPAVAAASVAAAGVAVGWASGRSGPLALALAAAAVAARPPRARRPSAAWPTSTYSWSWRGTACGRSVFDARPCGTHARGGVYEWLCGSRTYMCSCGSRAVLVVVCIKPACDTRVFEYVCVCDTRVCGCVCRCVCRAGSASARPSSRGWRCGPGS
jgi:hypothetical protein